MWCRMKFRPKRAARSPTWNSLITCRARRGAAPSPTWASAAPKAETSCRATTIQLLKTLSGYVGIAVENSKLYSSLQRKVDEYERLKEFSENIVESIHVGILAADLEDRVESWNSQMEKLTGVSRSDALERSLSSLLPAELCEQLEPSRGENGIQNIYQYPFPGP